MIESVQSQLERCHVALHALKQCVKGRRWHKLDERSQSMDAEMECMRLLLIDHPDLDDATIDQMRYLDIQFRRVQRQLSMHMHAVHADIQILERGISQANAAKTLLNKQ